MSDFLNDVGRMFDDLVEGAPGWTGLKTLLETIPLYRFERQQGLHGMNIRFYPPNVAQILKELKLTTIEDTLKWSIHQK